jgi:hypothetical protein
VFFRWRVMGGHWVRGLGVGKHGLKALHKQVLLTL